ncbi:hypothetical protein [Jiella marina]|uniref:hypothetical protein n=1 Tax=Jiella sp. LLJ827 TaxID=2917712 RepID=UPI0021013B6C|nr:hypothetical protein [Jiella sp. LLJ827]MCQ0990585.1 hypothetical protein [Jiella sp. LLJ827]
MSQQNSTEQMKIGFMMMAVFAVVIGSVIVLAICGAIISFYVMRRAKPAINAAIFFFWFLGFFIFIEPMLTVHAWNPHKPFWYYLLLTCAAPVLYAVVGLLGLTIAEGKFPLDMFQDDDEKQPEPAPAAARPAPQILPPRQRPSEAHRTAGPWGGGAVNSNDPLADAFDVPPQRSRP